MNLVFSQHLSLCFALGVFGFSILGLLLIPFYFIPVPDGFSDNPRNVLEDALEAFVQMGHYPMIIFALIGMYSGVYKTLYTPFLPLACAECDDSLPLSGGFSIPLCYISFPSTLFHQLVFHPSSLHVAVYFLVFLSVILLPNSYIILLWELCFLPFSVHAHTNVIYLTLYTG